MIRLKSILLFLLISLLLAGCGGISDGEYTASVDLTGGSGRAHIESPCRIEIRQGKAYADIIWSSKNYDYMIVDDKTYEPVNTEGNSEFVIPVVLDKDMTVKADTVAMSTPHLIEYTLHFKLIDGDSSADSGDPAGAEDDETADALKGDKKDLSAPEIPGIEYISTDENDHAESFVIHRYTANYAVICVDDGRKYLVMPEESDSSASVREDELSDDIIILKKPLDRMYLAASGVMCQFDAVSAVQNIALSGIDRDGWYIESAKKAMDDGKLIYGGKYSAPDYERMVADDIDLAIENTMILHVPKVQEKIEKLGIPVFIDRSSYEPEPLGRCEWIKVYGLLTGKESEAEAAFNTQKAYVDALKDLESTGKKVVIFSLNSNHQIVTRRGSDYFAKMVKMAGGDYLSPVTDDEEGNNSQVTISTEEFYGYAENADIVIYNATIVGAPASLQDLMDSDVTFSDFKAFKEGNIFYTDKSLYQYADKTGKIIDDLGKVIREESEDTDFFHKLK